MQNSAGSRKVASEKTPRKTPEALIMGCVNQGLPSKLSLSDLIRILKEQRSSGNDEVISRMFLEVEPKVLVRYFPERGVELVALVVAYERAKASTGRRSEPFERFLSGRFAFTS